MADVMQSLREMLARVEDCAATGPRDGLTFGWARLPVGRSGDQALYCFVATLHHSRLRFARFTTDQEPATLKRCLLAAFAYFGGVPALVCACQPQPALSQNATGVWVWEPRAAAFASALGFHLQARLPAHDGPPEQWHGAWAERRARGVAGQAAVLAELNRLALIRCGEWNWQPHPTTGQEPFLRAEEERLAPLPEASDRRRLAGEETPVWRLRRSLAQTRARLSASAARVLAWAISIAALACIAIARPGAWALLAALVFGLCILPTRGSKRQTQVTALLVGAVTVTAVDYLTWRIEVTNWIYWGLVATPLLAAEIFGALHTLGLQYTIWPWPSQRILRKEDPSARPIFIFIPTLNEGPRVLRPTIEAALEARRRYLAVYPHGRVTVVVCNDGRAAGVEGWWRVDDLARRLGAMCVTRAVGGGAKAGNLEHARQTLGATGDALMVIFDADQVAQPNFLLKTVKWFTDPAVGWVQTGQYYGNLEQPVARWAHDQQQLFYQVLCPGKATHNAAFICGTNVVIRAAALDQIGGLPQDSVTEDFAASLQLHPHWRSVFLTEILAVGLGPMDFPAYLKQQRRWAIGTIGVLRARWREILLPWYGGLNLQQRIQYALACTHYLCGLRDLVFVVSPLVFLITGIPAVRTATLADFLWHFIPYWLAAQVAFWHAGRGKTGLRGIIIGFGSFPSLIYALLIVALGRRSGFMVTAKTRSGKRSWSHLTIYALLIILCALAVWLGFHNTALRPESLAISAMWITYDIALLGSVLWLGMNDLRYKPASATVRARQRQPSVTLARAGLVMRSQRTQSVLALGLVTACFAFSGAALFTSTNLGPQPATFTVNERQELKPQLGLSLPIQFLMTRPIELEQQVCLPFTIIGRTQDIRDSFDFTWANQLAARGERPWITLQFGDLGANGVAPLSASLPAIANGLRDDDIRRWAQAIHDFGRPVLLTVLLHVDRNWAATSAVANGGIPQDVPRAWARIQDIFAAAGDTNVAWVWAPADPAHDEAYAPPERTITMVLQSLIRYPNTPWPDPQTVLSAVSARHPGKPLLVEISADGDATQKAAWIEQVAAAVQANPLVYALLYHEGGPDLHATSAEATQWSVESDTHSLDAMRSWQTLVPQANLPCQATGDAARQPPPASGGPAQSLAARAGMVADLARARR